ncbi:MAG: GNAT family N-acetyltransferase [Pirellulales bacterium]|nr:GNAT family N-acetyltransferase [Pirellulales bacterium]
MLIWMTTYYLETLDPTELRPSLRGEVGDLVIHRQAPAGTTNRRFYLSVGADWTWTDRLFWTDDAWETYARQPGLDTYIGYVGDEEIGYFELDRQPDGNTQLAYFGLLPSAIGRGLGARLLVTAIQQAWRDGARRVWVHTCTLDHPQALANYRARGMQLYKQESCWKEL